MIWQTEIPSPLVALPEGEGRVRAASTKHHCAFRPPVHDLRNKFENILFVPMHHFVVLFIFALTIRASFADTIIPTEPGMSWNYNMTQEVGAAVKFSDLKPDADGKYRAAVMYRLDGT